GVAHEINNPVNFIHGNIVPTCEYVQDLLGLIKLYQHHYPNPDIEIKEEIENIEFDFIKEDSIKILKSMKEGTTRIKDIVLSLRNFSRLDEAEFKQVDIHSGIDSTLMILHNRLKAKSTHPEIKIIKEYGDLPPVECFPGQLNQVFMNILANAIDALEDCNSKRAIEEIKLNSNFIKI
ncbi:MAG: PAS domain-containing sensor histidine kinase, partial [Cyanobacteria bacterium J06636_27]